MVFRRGKVGCGSAPLVCAFGSRPDSAAIVVVVKLSELSRKVFDRNSTQVSLEPETIERLTPYYIFGW
jgi:hypothetical protein